MPRPKSDKEYDNLNLCLYVQLVDFIEDKALQLKISKSEYVRRLIISDMNTNNIPLKHRDVFNQSKAQRIKNLTLIKAKGC